MKDFQGKTAVITGAAHGFGLEIAKECARRGMRLVLNDIDGDALNTVVGSLRETGAVALGFAADISIYENVRGLVQKAIENYGSLDFLVNNAGVYYIGRVWEMPARDVQWMLDVNVLSIFYGVREAVPVMQAQGTPCHILNVASLAGLITNRTMAAYHASKHAVVAASEAMLYDMQADKIDNIGLSVFCPGYIQTDLHNCWRHRPWRYKAPDDPYYGSDAYTKGIALVNKFITTGEPVDVVVPNVFRGIEENAFYISTENTYGNYRPIIEKRAQNIQGRKNPDINDMATK